MFLRPAPHARCNRGDFVACSGVGRGSISICADRAVSIPVAAHPLGTPWQRRLAIGSHGVSQRAAFLAFFGAALPATQSWPLCTAAAASKGGAVRAERAGLFISGASARPCTSMFFSHTAALPANAPHRRRGLVSNALYNANRVAVPNSHSLVWACICGPLPHAYQWGGRPRGKRDERITPVRFYLYIPFATSLRCDCLCSGISAPVSVVYLPVVTVGALLQIYRREL